jgi:hypothetical protein
VFLIRMRPFIEQEVPQDGERGVQLPLPALFRENADDLPDVVRRREMLPPVSREVLKANQPPGLKLLQPHGDIGTREAKRLRDFIGRERPGGQEQQGIDLPDGAVDAPPAAHFAKMQNEGLAYWREFQFTNFQ